jgi:hypothetical protein
VQRRFHVALIEAWCEVAGQPRVDPRKVDASGLVLRRLRFGRAGRVIEGWMRLGGVLRGWMPIDRLGPDRSDPLPAVRLAGKDTGVAQIDRALRALSANHESSLLEEDSSPMFVAPPDVCASAGHTFYYGVVPTASSELAESELDVASLFEGFEAGSAAFRGHLIQPLRGLAWTFPNPPGSGRDFDKSWMEALLDASPSSSEHRFLSLLQQLVVEFDLFGESGPARALHAQLQGVQLEYERRHAFDPVRRVAATAFVREAARVLLEGGAGSVEMPLSWPALSSNSSEALSRSLSLAMQERFKRVKGRPGRFDEPDAQYVLRAFVRMKPENGCPPRTIWSDYTEPFVIAPWWETAGDPVQVALPDLSNKELLKSLKPNVAFTLPPALQNLMSGSPKDLMEGRGSTSGGITIGWICSFSIPVITFCAFIVLNIFLSLLNLIFGWLMFIKICIPYPKAK